MRKIGFFVYLVVNLQACKINLMTEKIQFLIHLFVMLAKLFRPGGIKAVMTENLVGIKTTITERERIHL